VIPIRVLGPYGASFILDPKTPFGVVTGNSADGFCIKYAILWVVCWGYDPLRKMNAIMDAMMSLNGMRPCWYN
jgi:hypothetical protein